MKEGDKYINRLIDSDYVIKDNIGQGAFATVHKAFRIKDKQEYACKITNFEGYRMQVDQDKKAEKNSKAWTNAINEVRLISQLMHSNIVLYKETFFDFKKQ